MMNGIAPAQESSTPEGEPPVSPGPMSRLALLGRWLVRSAWRLAVLIAGTGLIGAGLALLVLPGPGIVVILLGLFVLASQFAWAELALDSLTRKSASAAAKATASRNGRILLGLSAAALMTGGGFVAIVDGGSVLVGVSLVVAGVIGLVTAIIEVPAYHLRSNQQERRLPRPLLDTATTPPEPATAERVGPSPGEPPWHDLGGAEVAHRLGVDPERGLDEQTVTARLAADGPNELAEAVRRSPWQVFEFAGLIWPRGAGLIWPHLGG